MSKTVAYTYPKPQFSRTQVDAAIRRMGLRMTTVKETKWAFIVTAPELADQVKRGKRK
jgi:hypothetical protein